MLAKEKAQLIEEKVESFGKEISCKFYDVDYISGSKTLQIFIEKEDGGVDLEDCSFISRKLSDWLDEVELFTSEYHLEVSSPGLERRLTKAWHYESAKGKLINMKLYERLGSYVSDVKQLEKAKNIKGRFISLIDENIKIDIDGQELLIPYSGVSKAQVVFETN